MLDGSATAAKRPDPRPSKHGGHTPTPIPSSPSPDRAQFDWYQATIDGVDDGRVPAALALSLGGELRTAKPRNGYGQAVALVQGDDVLATIYGRSARLGEVHVAMTGSASLVGVPVLRSLYPSHRVSRADSALDFVADFEPLDRQAVAFATKRGLKHSIIRNSDGGATRRIGSPASEVFVRLYKKTEQLRDAHPERAAEIPDGVVRAELVARPGNRATKEALSVLGADGLWGLGEWTRDYATEALAFTPERVPTHFRRPSDWSRMMHFLGLQYGPAIARRIGDVGLESTRAEVMKALGL